MTDKKRNIEKRIQEALKLGLKEGESVINYFLATRLLLKLKIKH